MARSTSPGQPIIGVSRDSDPGMPSSSPPPDRFQREIEDIVRLAEKRLERQSPGYRARKATHRLGRAFGGVSLRLPAVEVMAGWGLALLLLSWLIGLLRISPLLGFWAQVIGVALLVVAIVVSVTRGRGGGGGGGDKMWRGERISYGSPYGGGFLDRLRRLFRQR